LRDEGKTFRDIALLKAETARNLDDFNHYCVIDYEFVRAFNDLPALVYGFSNIWDRHRPCNTRPVQKRSLPLDPVWPE
jgi:hypothetical protein